MALSGLGIYKLLPKTNCKECGFATCLAFAMALAQKKMSLDKCPHITAQAKEALESASQPPIKLVTIGTGENRIEVGNETVMYRHEQKFFHPAAIGVVLEDDLTEEDLNETLSEIGKLKFDRVGQTIGVNLVCVKNTSGYQNKFVSAVKSVMTMPDMNIALSSCDSISMNEALKVCKEKRPLLICEDQAKILDFIKIAKENNLPIVITCANLEDAVTLTETAKQSGVSEIMLNIKIKDMARRIQDFTFIRRMALKKNFRALGYPIIAFADPAEEDMELAEAVSYISKYAGIVMINNTVPEFVFPVLVARQDIYQDPQKPVQVEPKIYEIGKANKHSPVLITTNFSITYFTVAGEVESSKVPSYIICCDSEGMSVLTAWAAEKFTAEKISETLEKSGIKDMVGHRKVIIPGYVSVLSGKLEEISGWKVSVGPREASGIPNFLRNWK